MLCTVFAFFSEMGKNEGGGKLRLTLTPLTSGLED